MLPWLIAPPALCAPALLLQDAEPALTPIPLTAAQKSMFDAFSKAGYKRTRVNATDKPEERYVSVEVSDKGKKKTMFVYVSPERTSITRSIEFEASAESGVFGRYEKIVKDAFPEMEVEEGILDDGYISLATPTRDLTATWGMQAIEKLLKADSLTKDASKPLPAPAPVTGATMKLEDPVGKTLKAAGYTFTEVGPFYKVRITFTDNKRAQNVFVRQAIWDYNSLKVQEVYSTFYESTTPPSAELLKKMVQKVFNIGGVILEQPSEKQTYWRLRFRLDAPTDITTARLRKYIGLAAGTADALEKEVSPDKEDTL